MNTRKITMHLRLAAVAALTLAICAAPAAAARAKLSDPYAPATFAAPYAGAFDIGGCYGADPTTFCSWAATATKDGVLSGRTTWEAWANRPAFGAMPDPRNGNADSLAHLYVPFLMPSGVRTLEVVATYVVQETLVARAQGTGGAFARAELGFFQAGCNEVACGSRNNTPLVTSQPATGTPSERAEGSTVTTTATFTAPAGMTFPKGTASLQPALRTVAFGAQIPGNVSTAHGVVRLQSLRVTPKP